MEKLVLALGQWRTENPRSLPLIRSVQQAVPVRGTGVRSGMFFILSEQELRECARRLWELPALRWLHRGRFNILAATLEHTIRYAPGCLGAPDRLRLVIYHYDENRGYTIEADYPKLREVRLSPIDGQPDYFCETEFQEAVQILAADPKYGEPLRKGVAFCSPGMPPVITDAAAPSVWGRFDAIPPYKPKHRWVSVLMHFYSDTQQAGSVGVFLVDMTAQRVAAHGTAGSDFYPASCGGVIPNESCPPNATGNAWQAIAWPAQQPIWQFMARRPRGSNTDGQQYGAGVEIADVFYRGRLVLKRAGMPVLNVFYDGDTCGAYRDWLQEETCFQCSGTDLGNGFRWASARPTTLCDTLSDGGNFRGVAIYEDGDELVLLSECKAGWYRYITGWRFHREGLIKPFFQYGYTDSGCVCFGRLHNGYWRLHFALDGIGEMVVEESQGGRPPRWNPLRIEARRLRWPQRNLRWRLRKIPTGLTAEIVPGARDGFFETYETGEGDLWFLKARDAEMMGAPRAFANLTQYVDGERIDNEDIVVWYGIHLRKRGGDSFECPPLGPEIRLTE